MRRRPTGQAKLASTPTAWLPEDGSPSAATTYAEREADYRGHLGAAGWAHAAAHTADLLKFLARNPRVSDVDAILDAVVAVTIRRHGHNFHHGEDGRVAGLLVDAVDEVLRLPEDAIQPAGAGESETVAALCERDGQFVSLIDLERVMDVDGQS